MEEFLDRFRNLADCHRTPDHGPPFDFLDPVLVQLHGPSECDQGDGETGQGLEFFICWRQIVKFKNKDAGFRLIRVIPRSQGLMELDESNCVEAPVDQQRP